MESIFRQILKHEGKLTFKLSSIACVAQLCVQGFPLPQPLFYFISWAIVLTVLAIGLLSDRKFYRECSIHKIKWERLKAIVIYCLIGLTTSLYLVKYLGIHEAAFSPDPEILEANLSAMEGPDFFRTKLMDEMGILVGVTLLLCAQYLAILTLICLSRIFLLLLQLIMVSFASCMTNLKKKRNMEKENCCE